MATQKQLDYNRKSSADLGWTPSWFGALDFDDDLIESIKRFQQAHGLTADGLCGPGWNAGEPCVMVTEGEDADVVLLEGPNRPDTYTVEVDRALGMESGQEDMFEAVGQPMVDHCMDGFNSTIFAYGQTGSGKTYTMMGEILRREDGSLHAESGLIPRVFDSLFTAIEEKERGTSVSGKDDTVRYSVKCSFLEIYNEEITDLLDPSASGFQIRDGDTARGVYVQGLSEKEVLNGAW